MSCARLSLLKAVMDCNPAHHLMPYMQVQTIVEKHQGYYTAQIEIAATPDFEQQDVYVSW